MFFFFLGDFFDNRQLLDINVMNKGLDVISRIASILPVYLMTGNHDIYKKKETDINSLAPFRYLNNVTVIEKPCIYTNGTSSIMVLPWIGDVTEEEGYMNKNAGRADYVFAHTDISGFKYDNGKNITKGMNAIEMSYKRILSGHIHKRQDSHNMHYIGSPYHTKRGDIGNKKVVYIFDPENNTLSSAENNVSPIFQRILLEDLLEWSLEYASSILANNYTDIVVPDKYIHLFNLTKFIELLHGCAYKKIEAVGEKTKVDEDISGIIDGETIKDIVTLLTMSINDLSLPQEAKELLISLNKEYYDKASKEETIISDITINN